MSGLFVTIVLLGSLVPGVVLVALGLRLVRGARTQGLVPVEAVVVHYTNFVSPHRVTFDYPAPDGSWLRATRVEGFSQVERRGWYVEPGARLTVYVDPANPRDVRLGQAASASSLGGVALVVAGCMFGLGGPAFLATVALALR